MAAGKTDDRGWSLADTFNGVDEGAAGGPPVPGGAAGAKANQYRRRRLKDSYSLLYTHQLDADIRSELTQNHFQNGETAWAYLIGAAGLRTPATRMQLRANYNALDVNGHICELRSGGCFPCGVVCVCPC